MSCPLSIPRNITLGAVTVLSTVAVCFVVVDRVTHMAFPAPHTAHIAKAPPVIEPDTTGTVTQGADIPEGKTARGLDGFDTERLNALMRGELPPAPVKIVARRR